MSGTLPSRIPLFPLPDSVLFPRMPLPLHVFEPRYRRLVEDVVASHRIVGMALLRPGYEADYEGRPAIFPLGCAGLVERCDSRPDQRFDIVLNAVSRFRILEEHAGAPYRIASVEPLPEPVADPERLARARRDLLAAIGRAVDGPTVLVLQNELPDDVFVNALCQSLPLGGLERQSLLDCDGAEARAGRLLELLEFRRLESRLGRSGSVH